VVLGSAIPAPAGSATCSASSLGATLSTNPPAPGTATAAVGTLSFSSCSGGSAGVSLASMTFASAAYTLSVNSDDAVSLVRTAGGATGVTLVFSTVLGSTTCVYSTPGLTGVASDADNSFTFVEQHLTKTSGPSLCVADYYLTGHYGPVSGSSPVFVN